MKKLFIVALAAIAVSSCSTLKNTATHRDFSVNTPFSVPVVADLDVSEDRVSFAYVPPKSVKRGGKQNVINTAVREALLVNGYADVLVGLETQIRFNAFKQIKSIVVTGYPAKYKNFRNLDEDIWHSTPYFQAQPEKRGIFLR